MSIIPIKRKTVRGLETVGLLLNCKVYGFTFTFKNYEELNRMITEFEGKHRGGDTFAGFGLIAGHGHDESQSDFSRLPMWLKDKKHRPRVLKALKETRKALL